MLPDITKKDRGTTNMTEFNIHKFLPDNIAKYCQRNNRVFTPLEMATIVFNSKRIVKKKREAYKAIININKTDMPIPLIEETPCTGFASLNDVLDAIISNEENEIDEMYLYEAYFEHFYKKMQLKIPPIVFLTDRAVKDAVFALVIESYKKDFEKYTDTFIQRYDNYPETFDIDFDSVTELELIMPESLDDLRFFPNLERLIICRPSHCKHSNALNAGILNCTSVDDLCIPDLGGKLKEVIIKLDLG